MDCLKFYISSHNTNREGGRDEESPRCPLLGRVFVNPFYLCIIILIHGYQHVNILKRCVLREALCHL